MKSTLAAAVNGALVLATCAGFLTLNAAPGAHGWSLAALVPSLCLSAAAAFVSIGGVEAIQAHRPRDVSLCAALAIAWTTVQVIFAVLLVSHLLPPQWLSLDLAEAWLLAGTAAQALLLAVVARAASRLPQRDLELK